IFKKEVFLILLFALILFSAFPVSSAFAYNSISAKVVLDNETGEFLYAENADARMEMASTTKILTAICVIEHNDIFEEVEVPDAAIGVEGSSVYLRKGERWRILDLLYGLMLRSGNDAATALAILTSGDISSFAALMNETARKAGATNSSFVNPHGLHDDAHYSTARDMALITAYALKCPVFAAICKTKVHPYMKKTVSGEEKGVFYNKNKLLTLYPDATGVKTGYTKHSGRCLVSSAKRGQRELICVVLNVYDTYGETQRLFDRCFERSS
ncbi:MAG: D-alanyl-D-alanine carboxypeptidase, partial [Clostridia bacterium]|nr:D-alanyl-D-alanine carboxypeptidase [Clostridia bacterium]